MPLKPYVIYSRSGGRCEGAALVFAHTVQEARAYGWHGVGCYLADSYLDLACNRLWDCDWLYKEQKSKVLPHVIDNPKYCKDCELWGQSPIGDDGLCEYCRETQETIEKTEDFEVLPEYEVNP